MADEMLPRCPTQPQLTPAAPRRALAIPSHGSPRSSSRAGTSRSVHRRGVSSGSDELLPGQRRRDRRARLRPHRVGRHRRLRVGVARRVDEHAPAAALLAPRGGELVGQPRRRPPRRTRRPRCGRGRSPARAAAARRRGSRASPTSSRTASGRGSRSRSPMRERARADRLEGARRRRRAGRSRRRSGPGWSGRSARAVHTCGVMQFWFASQTSVAASPPTALVISPPRAARRSRAAPSPARPSGSPAGRRRPCRSRCSSATGSAAGRATCSTIAGATAA